MSKRSGLDLIVTERELSEVVGPLVAGPGSTIRGILYPEAPEGALESGSVVFEHASATAADPCLLQHSSGTTGLQKPVVLSHRAVLSTCGATRRRSSSSRG